MGSLILTPATDGHIEKCKPLITEDELLGKKLRSSQNIPFGMEANVQALAPIQYSFVIFFY